MFDEPPSSLAVQLLDAKPQTPQLPASSPSPRTPHFGGKGISFVASLALTVNNISGAGMLEFPQMFQRAGLLPSMISLLFVCGFSTLFATALADTVARIPGNSGFGRRIEFSDIFEHYIGRRTAMLTQAVFFLNLLSQNLASIVACAQMFDSFAAIFWPGASVALRVSPTVAWVWWERTSCEDARSPAANCVPFASEGEDALLITAGYAATALLFAPLGLMTLEENMTQQKLSFAALLLLSTQFLFAFCSTGRGPITLPWVGDHWVDALGVVIFNFAFCVTVPSWLNEKAPGVSVNQVFWTSTVTSTLLYTCVGILGARAFADAPENMLQVMISMQVDVFTRLCGTLFGVLIIGLGVPIFCVIGRYNLVNGGLCSEPWAHVWSSVLPWGTAWLLYQGSAILKLLSWSGLLLNGFIDFLMPGFVTLVSLGGARRAWRCCHGLRASTDTERVTASEVRPPSPLLYHLSPPLSGSNAWVQPLPRWLHPFYFELIAGMVACLLVVLPVAVWLQVLSAAR
jgi:amino acid permease